MTDNIINRVIELMDEQSLNTNDEILVLQISIIYIQAQRDELVQGLAGEMAKKV